MRFRCLCLAAFGLLLCLCTGCGLFQVEVPHGSPIGKSVRGHGYVATLIATLEPYTPSLHRDPKSERRRLSVFVYPVGREEQGKLIPLDRQLVTADTTTALGNRILGDDGVHLWIYSDGLIGVNPRTGRRVEEAALRQANPSLGDIWTESARNITFAEGKLRIATPDRSRWWAIDPETLRAKAAELVRQPYVFPNAIDPVTADFASGKGQGSLQATEAGGVLVLRRVDLAGKVLWTADTGIGRRQLWQVLPDAETVVLTGTRPMVPNQVSEPLVVVIDLKTGATRSATLWQ